MPSETSSSGYVPQANDLDKVFALARRDEGSSVSYDAVAARFRFDERQAHYYVEASRELGLIQATDPPRLSELGSRIRSADERTALRLFIGRVLSLRVTRDLVDALDRSPNHELPLDAVAESVTAVAAPRYGGQTIGRRVECVVSWLRWLENNSEFVEG